MINRIKVLLVGLIILSFLFTTSCITINEAPKPTSTSTSTSTSSNSKEGLAPLQSYVASPDYNPAVDITGIVKVQSQIDQLFQERYNITYYDDLPELSERYAPHDENALQLALNDLKNLTQWNYVVNKFDCSNMSSLTQFYLANAGFRTIMVVGTDAQLNNSGHCWVVVFLSNPTPEAIPIECTTVGGPAIPSKDYPNSFTSNGVTDTQSYNDYLTGGWTVQDIYQAAAWAERNWGETLGSDNEFNWWDATQVNWSLLPKTVSTTTNSLIHTTTITNIRLPSIALNPLSASIGVNVIITGQGFTPNSVISTLGITIGGIFGNASSISIDTNGGFTYSFILPAVPNGTCNVKATDTVGKTASATITVTTPQTTPTPTLTLTPSSGNAGSTFTVRGYNFTPYGTVKSADISWNGTPLTDGNIYNVDTTGYVAFKLTLSALQSPATYTLKVTDSSGKSASTTFTVLPSTTATPITTAQTAIAPTLTSTPSSGSPGTSITLNGYNFTPNATVPITNITWSGTPFSGNQIYNVDSTGNFLFTFTLIASTAPGSYIIVVTDSSGKRASTPFTVFTPTITTPVTTQSTMPATLTLTPSSGSPGSSFTVDGYNFTPNGTVNPADTVFNGLPSTGKTINIDTTGHFSFTLTLSTSQSLGNFTILVIDSSRKSASTMFKVLAPTTTSTTNSGLFPANGATNVPVSGITFTWPAVSGTGITYQFALAQASANTSANEFAILDYSDNTNTNAERLQETLQYNTVYWWEFRAVTISSTGAVTATGAWTAQMFTTASHS
jgi:hypothetical protein